MSLVIQKEVNRVSIPAVDFAEPYGEGVQRVGYQGGENQVLVAAVSLIQKGKLVGVHQNGVVGKTGGGILFSPAQLKWIQDHMQGNFKCETSRLGREKKNQLKRKPKEDKPAAARNLKHPLRQ